MPAKKKLTKEEVAKRGGSVALFLAIQCAGGPSAVARSLGYTHGAPYQWVIRRTPPAWVVPKLVALSGGQVSEAEILASLHAERPEGRAAEAHAAA